MTHDDEHTTLATPYLPRCESHGVTVPEQGNHVPGPSLIASVSFTVSWPVKSWDSLEMYMLPGWLYSKWFTMKMSLPRLDTAHRHKLSNAWGAAAVAG